MCMFFLNYRSGFEFGHSGHFGFLELKKDLSIIWWLLETILFKPKVLYYLKIVTGPPKFSLKIQTLGGKPIIVANF